jgi:hypothetical protein
MLGEQRLRFAWRASARNRFICISYLEPPVALRPSAFEESIGYNYQNMIALDSRDEFVHGREVKQNRENIGSASGYERAKERYGLTVVFIDDNSVHVRDILGKEVAFEFPFHGTDLNRYDAFIQRMQDKNAPLPPIENVVLTIKRPLADVLRKPISREGSNSPTKLATLEQIAQQHGLTTDEMKWMYHLAREGLYERFRSRLRR